jgi:hypothetical protein
MRSFYTRRRYFRSIAPVFTQAQFAEFEDIVLEQALNVPVNFTSFPVLSLNFSLPHDVSRYELARVLYIFRRIFATKPKISPCTAGYRVHVSFPIRKANHLMGFFMRLYAYTRTKFLRFFFSETSFDFSFLLFEPITFFPLVHPGFDYHDWVYPFEFLVKFSIFNYKAYYDDIVDDVFNI